MSGMEARNPDLLDRRAELLADRALQGLDDSERDELRTACAAAGTEHDREFDLELTAAEVVRAMHEPAEAMPADVADRIRAVLAERQRAAASASGADGPSPTAGRIGAGDHGRTGRGWTILRAAGGFAAAAAIALVAIVMLRERFAPVVDPGAVADARAALISRATDLVTMRWQATDHPDIRRARDMGLVGGEVIWSDDESEGFVRVCHLGINDPVAGSYRVWIWNADELDGPPVASCRFDVTQVSDFTVVPIEREAAIRQPVRASVTLEAQGADVRHPDPADELLVARLIVPPPTAAPSDESPFGRRSGRG